MTAKAQRQPLTKERIVAAALAFAEDNGIESLSMRKLAADLGAGAMSLYNHVADKDELLRAMVDEIVSEIELPAIIDGASDPAGWRATMRASAMSARDAYVRHPWALAVVLRTQPGPQRMRYVERVLGAFASSGLDEDLAHHAYHAYEVHISGWTLTHIAFDFDDADLKKAAGAYLKQLDHEQFPHMAHHVRQHLDERDSDFEFGLDLLLDGLERLR